MDDAKRFADFTRIGSDWLWETDSLDRFSYFSVTTSRTGLTFANFIGALRLDGAVQNPENLARLLALDEMIARREFFHDVAYQVYFGEPPARWCSISGEPRYDPAGVFLGYRGVGRDVTAQVEAQQALESQVRTLQAILRAIPDGVRVTDKTETTLAVNDQLYEILGIPNRKDRPDSFLQSLHDLAERGEYGPGDPAPLARERFDTMLKRIESAGSVTYQRELKTGRWVEVRLSAFGDGGHLSLYRDVTGTKQHEAELERQATLLQTIFTNFPGGISVFDGDNRLIAWNERYADIIGADPTVVRTGATPREILISIAKAGELGPYAPEVAADRRLASLQSGRMDFTERERPNGRALEMRHGRLPGGGTVSIYLDITERKQATRALNELTTTLEIRVAERTAQLAESQRFLSSLMASVPGMVYRRWQGRKETTEFVSDGSDALLGIVPDKFVSGEVVYHDLIHPDDRNRARQEVQDDLTMGEVFDLEYRVRHVDGSWRWVHDRGRLVRGDPRSDGLLEGLITNITDRKMAEQNLARARDHLADAAEGINHGLTLYDHEGRLVLATRFWFEYYPDSDKIFVIGHTFEQVIRSIVESGVLAVPPGQAKEEFIAERLAQHKRADGSVILRHLPNGRVLHLSDHPTPSGGILTVGTDITEQIQIEERLREAERIEAIARLSGSLAHDLNNYLAVTMGNLDLLAECKHADPEAPALIADAITSVERGAELIRSLLSFSQRQPLAPRRLDVGKSVAGIVELLKPSIGKEIAVEFSALPGLWPIKLDATQFEKCVVNLVNNAKDAMPDGGTITISLRNVVASSDEAPLGNHVLLEIRDTGSGMSQEIQARAYEPFFTTKPPGHGVGLGLSMVYGFVHQSGGIIRVISEVGRGTTVRIYLPSVGETAVATKGEAKDGTSAAVRAVG